MARYTEHDTSKIYCVAAAFRDNSCVMAPCCSKARPSGTQASWSKSINHSSRPPMRATGRSSSNSRIKSAALARGAMALPGCTCSSGCVAAGASSAVADLRHKCRLLLREADFLVVMVIFLHTYWRMPVGSHSTKVWPSVNVDARSTRSCTWTGATVGMRGDTVGPHWCRLCGDPCSGAAAAETPSWLNSAPATAARSAGAAGCRAPSA